MSYEQALEPVLVLVWNFSAPFHSKEGIITTSFQPIKHSQPELRNIELSNLI